MSLSELSKRLSYIQRQPFSLKYKKVDLDNAVDDAEEGLKSAKFPTSVPLGAQSYVDGILIAQKKLDVAKEEVEANNAATKYFADLLETF